VSREVPFAMELEGSGPRGYERHENRRRERTRCPHIASTDVHPVRAPRLGC
jgi:hypothetical protein